MAIDFRQSRDKISKLSQGAILLADMLKSLEGGTLFGMALTPAQISNLEAKLKSEADKLKSVAGEIKTLVS